MPISVKATIRVNTDGMTSRMSCPTPKALATETVHIMVQAFGTETARQLLLEMLDQHDPAYPGYDAALDAKADRDDRTIDMFEGVPDE